MRRASLLRFGLRRDQEPQDGFLAKGPARLKSMEPFNQHIAITILADPNWRLLPYLQDAFSDLMNYSLFERGPSFYRHINLGNREALKLEHREPVLASTGGAYGGQIVTLSRYQLPRKTASPRLGLLSTRSARPAARPVAPTHARSAMNCLR